MRFHFGAIPHSPDFAPDTQWRQLHEPSPWLSQLIALPIGVLTAAIVAFLWFAVTPLQKAEFTPMVSTFLLILPGMIVVHELIHAAVHPMAGYSSNSILGFWPSKGVFYAHFDGELSRNRFIAILLMPTLVMSVFPLIIMAILQVTSGWMAFISSFNIVLACNDILGAGMVFFQIPATATVRNQGWNTFWRDHTDSASS